MIARVHNSSPLYDCRFAGGWRCIFDFRCDVDCDVYDRAKILDSSFECVGKEDSLPGTIFTGDADLLGSLGHLCGCRG